MIDNLIELVKFIDDKNISNVYRLLLLIVSGIFLFGILIGWLINHIKTNEEIKKIRAEVSEKEINILNKIYETKNVYESEKKKLETSMFDLFEALKKQDYNDAEKNWREVYSNYYNGLCNSFFTCLDYKKRISFESKKEIKDFIEDVVFEFLSTSKQFYETMNMDSFKCFTSNEEIRINKSTFNPIFRYIENNIKVWDFSIQKKLKVKKAEFNNIFNSIS